MVPNDATIKAFAGYLPAEAEYQEEVMNEEADAEVSEYYDEEEDAADSNSDENNDQPDSAANGDATTQADTNMSEAGTNKPEEEKKHSDDDSENEYDSDYDEEGRYIWGAENEDWEFYYQEDKEAYEAGLSTVPECLNPGSLPVPGEQQYISTTTATGQTTSHLIGVSLARDGAVYRTTKKKLKQAKTSSV